MMINRIISIPWTWYWSGNWPMLDNFYVRDRLFQKEFEKIIGTHPKVSLDFNKDGILSAYHSQDEYDRMEKHFLKKFRMNSKIIIETYKNYQKKTSQDIAELRKINKLPLKDRSNEQLVRLFKRTRKLFAYNSAYDHYSCYVEKFFLPLLENFLRSRLKSSKYEQKQIPYYLTLLVTPQKPSKVYKERVAFFELVKKVKEMPDCTEFLLRNTSINKSFPEIDEKIKESFPEIDKQITIHAKRFGYLPVLVNNPATKKQDVLKEINKYLKNNGAFRIESVRLGDFFDPKVKQKVNHLLKRLKPNKRIINLINGLRDAAFARNEDNAIMAFSTYLILPLQNEICSRLGISYSNLKELVPDEIIYCLRYHLKVPEKLIKKRKKLTAYYIEDDNIYLFTGKKAFEIKNAVEAERNIEKNFLSEKTSDKTKLKATKEFKGTTASIGKVEGKAFVAKSSAADLSRFKHGDILIAPATSADFVPTMRKASAIVTEMGGITSHAGIVSREFGVPCIVGVKNITSLLKTGDLIEVNGNDGVVRKV